jgi:hypothetical protein
MAGLMMLSLCVYFGITWAVYRQLQQRPYVEYRVANVELRLQVGALPAVHSKRDMHGKAWAASLLHSVGLHKAGQTGYGVV